MRLRAFASSLSALALAACAVGPDYVAPTPPAPASGPFLSAANAALSTAPADDQWWHLYRDSVLDGLVADALKANTDLRVAVARLERARAALREVRSDRLPSTDLSAGYTYGREAAVDTLPGQPREGSLVDGGLDVNYELDLFGRVKRNIEAGRADAAAAQADADAVRVAVVADVTQAYADAASDAERIAVAQHIVDLLDRSLNVTSRRQDVGLTTPLDTARIAALREQRAADIPTLQADRQAALFRLATLTGRTPAELPTVTTVRTDFVRLDQPIPVGDGAGLLARRPDVRAAERRLAAATARIGVATSDLYPHITLGGSIGQTSTGFSDLFGAGPLRWLVGPLISWSFPNQERIRARITEAKADTSGALATFDGTVLTALRETETSLSNYGRALDRRTRLQAARDQAERAVRIVRAQAREGQIDSLALLDAERTFADAEAQLAESNGAIADAQVAVFRSLGGGWQGGAQVAAR